MKMNPVTTEEAFAQGIEAFRAEAQEDQIVSNPYDDDTESELYKAWASGFAHGPDTYGENTNFGI
jgi:hypothetical protein